MTRRSTVTLAPRGAHGSLLNRGAEVSLLLDNAQCLGATKYGEPRHPLYIRSDTELVPYRR